MTTDALGRAVNAELPQYHRRNTAIGVTVTLLLLAAQITGIYYAIHLGGLEGKLLGGGVGLFTLTAGLLSMRIFYVAPRITDPVKKGINLPVFLLYIIFSAFLPAICMYRKREILHARWIQSRIQDRPPPDNWCQRLLHNCVPIY